MRFDVKDKDGKEAWGTLHLPPNYASAWIIDGQHRLYGYAYARGTGFNQDATVLPVLAYENLPVNKEISAVDSRCEARNTVEVVTSPPKTTTGQN